MNSELDDVSSRLQVMRSMPDLTISPADFDDILRNALAQPKLRPNPLSSGDGNKSFKTQKLVAPKVRAGSMQHIFPQRDWARGGMIKKLGH